MAVRVARAQNLEADEVADSVVKNFSLQLREALTVLSLEFANVEAVSNRSAESERPVGAIKYVLDELATTAEQMTAFVTARGPTGSDRIRVDEVLEAHVDVLDMRTRASGRELVAYPIFPVTAMASQKVVEEFLYEAVENACRFTPRNSSIFLSWTLVPTESPDGAVPCGAAEKRKLILSVDDNGPGLDQAGLFRIGLPFWRSACHRSTRGAGLGLATVRRRAESAGSEFNVGASAFGGIRVSLGLMEARASTKGSTT